MNAPELFGLALLRPGWLLALLPLGVLVWLLARGRQGGTSGWQAVIDPRLLPHLLKEEGTRGRAAGIAALALGLAGAVLALAGPARPGAADLAWRSDAARVLVVDLSPGMGPSNAERARLELLELLRAAPGGQTALVAYADEPYLVAPLTSDATTIALLVPELAPEVMPRAGDRPDRALRMAGEILAGSGAGTRDLVWVTATGEPSPAVKAVGGFDGVRLSVLHLPAGQEAAAHALRRAAETSGGRYIAWRADGEDMRAIAELLADAPGTVADGLRLAGRARELGPWLAALLLPLAALAFRRGVLLTLALPLLLLPPPAEAFGEGPWAGADRRALRLFEAGDPEAAAQVFADPRWQAVAWYRAGRYAEAAAALAPLSDADSHYNRGNALARLSRLPEALEAYEAALALRPGDEDFRHNRDLVRALLADRNEDPPPPSGRQRDKGGRPERTPGSGAGQASGSDADREAALLADQWLRRVPDEPGGLLRRKLLLEDARRRSGEASTPW